MSDMSVYLVVTCGRSSLDLYSNRLSQHLNVPRLHTDIYARVSSLFGATVLSPSVLEGALTLLSFSKALNRLQGVPHLTNQHLGRFAHLLKKPFIITVHDLVRYLDLSWGGALIRKPSSQDRIWIPMDFEGIKKAAKIIVPSNHTKGDVIRYLKVPEEKVEVVHHGVDDLKARLGRRPCPEPYVLYVGTEHPRKNLKVAFRAFKLLKEDHRFEEMKFVKVGRAGGRERDFRKDTLKVIDALGIAKDVVFIDWVAKEDLESFYTQAELFVFPSMYEGFGWPPLEAMRCGCPVLASSTTCMPEILGDAAVLLNPLDHLSWRGAMLEVLTDEGLRRELRRKGVSRAGRFSWRRTAEKTMEVYREVAGLF